MDIQDRKGWPIFKMFLLILIQTFLFGCGDTTNQPVNNELIEKLKSNRLPVNRDNDFNIRGILVSAIETSEKPVEAATVYILRNNNVSDSSNSKYYPNHNSRNKIRKCTKPNEDYLTYTCSSKNGAFVLDIPKVIELPIVVKIIKGDKSKEILVRPGELGLDIGKLIFPLHRETNKSKIAVVTDFLGPLQDVIREFIENSANTDSSENQARSSELIDLFDRKVNLDEIEFVTFSALFTDNDKDEKADINNYDAVYIYGDDEGELVYLDKKIKNMLTEFISNGGELYITNWSFEIVEPEVEQYV